ncbi:MAG TPA: VanZ family protein [Paenibacillaceae bacterium]
MEQMGEKREAGWKIFWFYGLPLLLWMGLIFLMSSQPYERQNLQPLIGEHVPGGFVERLFAWVRFSYGGSEVSVGELGAAGFVEFFVRKAAHVAEYFVLGWLSSRLLRVWLGSGRSVAWRVGIAALFCLFYAVTDEIHQSFTPQRTAHAADVLLDAVSGLLGAAAHAGAVRFVGKRKIARPR